VNRRVVISHGAMMRTPQSARDCDVRPSAFVREKIERLQQITRREDLRPTMVEEMLSPTLQSLAVARALLVGKSPRTLSLMRLKNTEVPWSWDDQERLFGRLDGRSGSDSVLVSRVECESYRTGF
jgi:hypothetical protein